jgi:DNA-binding protein HU-beta
MKKTDVIDFMAKETGMSKADSEKSLNAFLNALVHCLKSTGEISLVGYFKLTRVLKKAKVAHNPRTQQKVNVPERMSVKIKPGKCLLDAVSDSKAS